MPIWGAVEQFSGFSSTRWLGFNVASFVDYGATFKKLQVRVLGQMIKVYVGVGLPAVWAAVNSLYSITGQPLLAPNQYARWSLREIFTVSLISARNDKFFHVMDVVKLLTHAPPSDTPPPPPPHSFQNTVSLRSLLEPAR
jgi:hypothetical protein